MNSDHPSMWRFFTFLQKEQQYQEIAINCALRGEQPKKPEKYAENDAAIAKIVNDYGNYETLLYLKAISYRLPH